MRFTPESNFHPNVPPQHRCVWMAAGILSYQLCDRSFDCDSCPLDAAMRMHFSRKDVAAHHPARREERHGEHRFSANHCWVATRDHAEVRVGVEPALAALLTAREIVLPFVGDTVTRDAYCCWVVMEGGTFHITAPVSGTVTAVNASVAANPRLLADAPLADGWLFELRTRSDHQARHGLLSHAEADARYRADRERFDGLVRESLGTGKERVGFTLADGGRALHDLAAMLGPKRYCELIERAFGAPKRPA